LHRRRTSAGRIGIDRNQLVWQAWHAHLPQLVCASTQLLVRRFYGVWDPRRPQAFRDREAAGIKRRYLFPNQHGA
jgi:hypothetical protein